MNISFELCIVVSVAGSYSHSIQHCVILMGVNSVSRYRDIFSRNTELNKNCKKIHISVFI